MSWTRSRTILAALAAATVSGLMAAAPAAADAPGEYVHTPAGPDESNIYARTIALEHAGELNGRLLMTFERDNPTGGPIELIVKSSDDDGATWETLSTVADERDATPVSRMWQPELFEFPTALGEHPAGTLMLVANLVPADGSVTEFFSWYSHDHGATWEPGAVVQTGGTFGRGIWEPHLVLDRRGALQMYFADERSAPEHSQMIVHVTSRDGGATWSDVTRDVASALPGDRPGMPSVTRMGARGDYVLSYEICGRAHCNVHVKTSRDGARWGDPADVGPQVRTEDGRYPGHSPFVTWVPNADGGQLVLSAQRVFSEVGDAPAPEDYRALFLNDGDVDGPWDWAPAPWTVSNASPGCNANYSPHVMPAGAPGDVRLTAPTSFGAAGPCAEATGVAQVGTMPFASAFGERGEAGWITYGGSWQVDGDVYRQTDASGFPKAVTGSTGWTDYTVRTEIMVGPQTVDAGLLARVSDPAEGPDSHHGYYAGVDPVGGRIFLARQDYAYMELAGVSVPGGIARETWHELELTVVDTRRGVRLEATWRPASGEEVTVTALDPYDSFTSGMVGLRSHDGEVAFRSVTVEPA
ncbi:glycosyl hydrolase BNR repeat-containing protein [Beutenbergia cavernae DSM 12333]|uniref:Glycosyl hydrolase BNR repeat-containing protein n=1 Tax=Beutenbergia cavernae (strain ATCC BAA-8 / DSM 12333 / CCUG 43141 / JCM 11478 / NBRC 16432 / NCIMB 13614 / HKI 0122) TaxID=471853 RepID=C5BZI0_BEUC1|nr:exo-alpha-sialidase [Beutenbergia cavernae]ACQ79152.1 glycosyl hydrolase BNR repeat-containing protein [Beutenbergia cavernae DSM 12333]